MLTETMFEEQKEVERLFAACVFIDPEYVNDCCGWLKPEVLADERIRKFWTLILEGKSNVVASHETDLQIDLLKWVNQTPSLLNVSDYANLITAKSYQAGISIQIGKIAKSISVNDISETKRLIDEMAAHQRIGKEDIPGAEQIGLEFIDALMAENNDIPTGIPELDSSIGGLERHTTSVIAGRTSMGKTALALQVARNIAGPGKQKVIFFSLEMKRKNLWARMACGNAEVSWLDKRAGRLSPDDEQRLLQENDNLIGQYSERLFVVDDTCDTERIWQITADQKPAVIVIDHLRLVKDKMDNEVKRQGWITERLHDLSKAQDCHVMILAQLNRGVDTRTDHKPVLADLRDSGEIEENADLVMMLYRPDIYDKESKPQLMSETHLLIRKHRDGVRNARIKLIYDTRKQWFVAKEERYKDHSV